jgi:hypothetical protein
MKRTTKILILTVFALFFGFSAEMKAGVLNNGLKIDEVFERFGSRRNATMVELSQEMLEMYNMKHYKSITIRNDPDALHFIRQALEHDQQSALIARETVDENGIVSAFYQLTPGSTGLNRFILFNVNARNVITLVYIEGDLDSDELAILLLSL